MRFHLIVPDVLFSLKTCLRKDRGDSFSWLLEREIWLSCIEVLLLVLWSIRFGNHPIDFFKKTWYSGDWVSFYMTFKFQGFWKLEIRQWSKGYNALTFCQKLHVYNLVTAYHYSGINILQVSFSCEWQQQTIKHWKIEKCYLLVFKKIWNLVFWLESCGMGVSWWCHHQNQLVISGPLSKTLSHISPFI